MSQFVCNPLYQWDVGRKMRIYTQGNDVVTRVGFANKGDSRAVSVDVVGGEVKIPDKLLQTGRNIVAYAMVKVADGEYQTVGQKEFPVRNREKPKDYMPTAAEESLAALREITERAEKAAENAENAASVMFVVADDVESTVSRTTEEIYNHVKNGGIVYLNENGRYAVLIDSVPDRAVFLGESNDHIWFCYVDGDYYYSEQFAYTKFAEIDDNREDKSSTWSSEKISEEISKKAVKMLIVRQNGEVATANGAEIIEHNGNYGGVVVFATEYGYAQLLGVDEEAESASFQIFSVTDRSICRHIYTVDILGKVQYKVTEYSGLSGDIDMELNSIYGASSYGMMNEAGDILDLCMDADEANCVLRVVGSDITGYGDTSVVIRNVAAGVNDTDAVNKSQMEASIDSRIGDIETALDTIIAIQKELIGVTLITFYIYSDEYTAEEGMTWGEYIESGYNTSGFTADETGLVYLSAPLTSEDTNEPVYVDDLIISGGAYYD